MKKILGRARPNTHPQYHSLVLSFSSDCFPPFLIFPISLPKLVSFHFFYDVFTLSALSFRVFTLSALSFRVFTLRVITFPNFLL